MGTTETINSAPFYFELSTGTLHTNQACIEAVRDTEAPRNLEQLIALGRLVVADTSRIDLAVERSRSNDVRELRELINDKETILTAHDYEHLPVAAWTDEDYVGAGQWLSAIMSTDDQPQALKANQVKCAYYLGLFSSIRRITSPYRFGNLARFNRALGATPRYTRYEYNDWSEERFADYLEAVFLAKDENQTLYAALWANSRADAGPSPEVIAKHTSHAGKKNITHLLNNRGYSIGPRDRQAYIEGGVRTMLVNDGRDLHREKVIRPLRARRRGSSVGALEQHFGGTRNFNKVVREEYAAKLEAINKDVANDLLPGSLFEDKLTDCEHVRRAAQYKLIESLKLNMEEWQKKLLARITDSTRLVSSIQQHSMHVSENYIKAVARKTGLYDDIWTLEKAQEYLRVE